MPYSIIGALAGAGVLETAYLTYSKLFNSPVVCSAAGACQSVLSSPYSSINGVPLSAIGLLTYGAVAAVAVQAARAPDPDTVTQRHQALVLGSSLLTSASAFLIWTLFSRLDGAPCTWCFLSAALSASIAAATWINLPRREVRSSAASGAGVFAASVLALSLSFRDVPESNAGSTLQIAYAKPEVTAVSEPGAVDLARRLREGGAKMYGAFWCSHCFDQKQSFGVAAEPDFPYVECYPNGYKSGEPYAEVCAAEKIEGFPTWVINGKKIEGEQTFRQLEAALDKE